MPIYFVLLANAVEVLRGADEELAGAGGDGGSEDFFVVFEQVAAADDFQGVGGFDDDGFSAVFDESDQTVVRDRAGGDCATDAFLPVLFAVILGPAFMQISAM